MSKQVRSERYWNRKHSKGIEREHIECTYWACSHRSIAFAIDTKRAEAEHACSLLNKNLNYWWGSNSPCWCPRRKANNVEMQKIKTWRAMI